MVWRYFNLAVKLCTRLESCCLEIFSCCEMLLISFYSKIFQFMAFTLSIMYPNSSAHLIHCGNVRQLSEQTLKSRILQSHLSHFIPHSKINSNAISIRDNPAVWILSNQQQSHAWIYKSCCDLWWFLGPGQLCNRGYRDFDPTLCDHISWFHLPPLLVVHVNRSTCPPERAGQKWVLLGSGLYWEFWAVLKHNSAQQAFAWTLKQLHRHVLGLWLVSASLNPYFAQTLKFPLHWSLDSPACFVSWYKLILIRAWCLNETALEQSFTLWTLFSEKIDLVQKLYSPVLSRPDLFWWSLYTTYKSMIDGRKNIPSWADFSVWKRLCFASGKLSVSKERKGPFGSAHCVVIKEGFASTSDKPPIWMTREWESRESEYR